MKKKKHHKKSISRKLRDESNIFFSGYENNVTRSSFIRNYAKFIEYCRKDQKYSLIHKVLPVFLSLPTKNYLADNCNLM